jgi:hypothetical protein
MAGNNSEQSGLEKIIGVFQRFDETGAGKISGGELVRVMQALAKHTGCSGLDIGGLIQAFGVSTTDTVNYAEFVSFIFCADEITKQSSFACQAALDGDTEAVRRIWESYGAEAFKQSHFVRSGGTMAGLISLGGHHAVHLQGLSEGPPLPAPAMALQYAALAGKTQVSKFLLEKCGLSQDDEGTFGASPTYIAKSHRLGVDDQRIVDEPDFNEVFEEEDNIQLGLCMTRVRTGALSGALS